jgi:membrane fusion protein, multidrug efflux system
MPTRIAPDVAPVTTRTALVSAVAALTLFLTGCSSSAAAPSPAQTEAIPVRVSPLASAAVAAPSSVIEVTGTLAGKEEVALAFKIGGIVSRVSADPGQAVRAGQMLAALRPTEIAAQVATAQEAAQKAQRDLARVTTLYQDSVATLEQLQDARTGVSIAQNSLRIAQFNAEYAVIRAPGDGVVLARLVEPGQVVEPGRAVLTVRRNGRGMVVRVGLADHDAVRVRIGDAARITFDALPGKQFSGRVSERAGAASPGTGDYAAEITLSSANNTLPTGLVARVTLTPQVGGTLAATLRGGVRVPLDALVDADADSAAVFVLSANRQTVSRRAIRLADVAEAFRSGLIPVTEGLDGTETVVVAGTARLLDGTRVSIVQPAAGSAQEPSPTWTKAP